MRHTTLAALAGAMLLLGCGGDDDSAAGPKTTTAARSTAGEPTATIKIVDFAYEPTPATVRAGRKISVPNADAAPHTLTDAADDATFGTGTIEGKATGSMTIERPGSYKVFCELHPFMRGEITVTR